MSEETKNKYRMENIYPPGQGDWYQEEYEMHMKSRQSQQQHNRQLWLKMRNTSRNLTKAGSRELRTRRRVYQRIQVLAKTCFIMMPKLQIRQSEAEPSKVSGPKPGGKNEKLNCAQNGSKTCFIVMPKFQISQSKHEPRSVGPKKPNQESIKGKNEKPLGAQSDPSLLISILSCIRIFRFRSCEDLCPTAKIQPTPPSKSNRYLFD